MKPVKNIIRACFYFLIIPLLIIYTFFIKKNRRRIIFGPVPMINYKYWSEALNKHNYDSITLVSNVYKIYAKDDFNLYYDDLMPSWLNKIEFMKYAITGPIFSYLYVVKNAKLINISFIGGFLGNTPIWFLENFLYKIAGIKIVVTGFGGDFYMYSKLLDQSLKQVLLMSYPDMAKKEILISKKVKYWTKRADAIINGVQLDGLGRWSCLPVNMISISNDKIVSLKKKVKRRKVLKMRKRD